MRDLKEEGYGIRQIARITGLSRQTVRRYLNPNIYAIHGSYGMSRECALALFHNIIDDLITRGQTFKKIEEYIRNKGYTGSSSAIRMYTTKKRRLIQETLESDMDKYELVDRKHLIKLLYKPINKVKVLLVELLNRIIREYPILSTIYNILTTFKEILFSKEPGKLTT